MTPAVNGYYYGYQGKQAASDNALPRETWWNLLPGHALEEAGRGKAIFEAQGKEPPKTVKHPVWNMIKSLGLGAGAGALAGAGVGSALSRYGTPDVDWYASIAADHAARERSRAAGRSYWDAEDQPKVLKKPGFLTHSDRLFSGSAVGAGVGAIAGIILALRSSLKRTQAEAKSLEERGITPEVSEKARQLVEEKSKKNALLHGLAGIFVGPTMHGRTSQLQTLMEPDPDRRGFPAATRALAGLQSPGNPVGPVQGVLSVLQAREALKTTPSAAS